MIAADARVPRYLGRVLDSGGVPVGTCFQVAPGVLETAWHVLDDIGAVADGACVRIDPLAGGEAFDADVARIDSAPARTRSGFRPCSPWSPGSTLTAVQRR